jgi:hypothetical protein
MTLPINATISGVTAGVAPSRLLLEDGDGLLLEDGGSLLTTEGTLSATVEVQAGTFTVDDGVDERAVCRLVVVDPDGTVTPQKGQRLTVTTGDTSGGSTSVDVTVDSSDVTADDPVVTVDGDGATADAGVVTLYDGYIERVDTLALPGTMRLHTIEAIDHHYLADKRLAAVSYTGKTVRQIVTDLWDRYLRPEGVVLGNVDDGPVVDLIVFPYKPVSEALTELADLAGYWWYITTRKSLDFRKRQSLVAPWTLTADPLEVPYDTSTRISHAAPDYRNVQYVRNVRDLTDLQRERFRGDGDMRTFSVGFDLAQVPTVTINGELQTVGIQGVEQGKQWYWNKGDNTLTQDESETPLSASDVLLVEYVGQFDAVVLSADQVAIDDRLAVEGGTGRVESVVDDRRLDGRGNAFRLAASKLAKYGQIGRTFQFTTRRAGLRPGMLLPVVFDPYQLDTEMLVVEMETFDFEGVELRWTVTAVEGPHDESWSRFFTRLFETPEVLVWSENTSDIEVLTRLFEFDKTWTAVEDPNIFAAFLADGTYTAGDARTPAFASDVRLTHVELTYSDAEAAGSTKLRKPLTQRVGLDTDEITSTLYVTPFDANGVVTVVDWYGGHLATGEVGSGVKVAEVLLGETKTAAEAWNLVRTDTKWDVADPLWDTEFDALIAWDSTWQNRSSLAQPAYRSDTNVMRVALDTLHSGDYYGLGGYRSFTGLGLTERSEGYFHYRVYFPAGSPIDGSATGGDTKTAGIGGGVSAAQSVNASGGTMPADAWSVRIQHRVERASWYGTSMGHPFAEVYLYVHHVNGDLFSSGTRDNAGWGHIYYLRDVAGTGNPLPLPIGQWVDYKIFWRQNTAGNNDGVVRVWQDGVLGADLTDVRFCTDEHGAVSLLPSTFTNSVSGSHVDYERWALTADGVSQWA